MRHEKWSRWLVGFVTLGLLLVLILWVVSNINRAQSKEHLAEIKANTVYSLIVNTQHWNSVRQEQDLVEKKSLYKPRQVQDFLQGTNIEAKLTSLKLVNPLNAPTDYEKSVLLTFSEGKLEPQFSTIEGRYSYMFPLLVDKRCLACHAQQRYKIGDVRGALVITFPTIDIDGVIDHLSDVAINSYIIAFSIITILGSLFWYISKHYTRHITTTIEKVNELKDVAEHDALTKLLNRQSVYSLSKNEFEQCLVSGQPFSMCMIDIDYFKMVNDTFGHPAGDKVLIELASLLKQQFRDIDYVGRYGGEEFVVLLPHIELDQAVEIAERVRLAVEDMQVDVDVEDKHYDLSVTISLGIAELSKTECTSLDELIVKADKALYESKNNGRNRITTFIEVAALADK